MTGFFEEVKRRKVYRVAAAYIIVVLFVGYFFLKTREIAA